jgi:hypothetical protein
MVGMTFARSPRFWAEVETATPAGAVASELIPCEGQAHLCIVGYVELARDALAATADRPADVARRATHMRVIQHNKRLVWAADDQPLTTRTRHARFSQYDAPLETLELVLEGCCAERGCKRPPSRDAKVERRRLSRCVCCLPHETPSGTRYRRQVYDLLTRAQAIIERAENAGGQVLTMPAGTL